jgi:hypothetical protein
MQDEGDFYSVSLRLQLDEKDDNKQMKYQNTEKALA